MWDGGPQWPAGGDVANDAHAQEKRLGTAGREQSFAAAISQRSLVAVGAPGRTRTSAHGLGKPGSWGRILVPLESQPVAPVRIAGLPDSHWSYRDAPDRAISWDEMRDGGAVARPGEMW